MPDREMTILMPVEIGTLNVGDEFIDPRGYRCRVVGVFSDGVSDSNDGFYSLDSTAYVERTITGPVVDAVERGLIWTGWCLESSGEIFHSNHEPPNDTLLYRIPEGGES